MGLHGQHGCPVLPALVDGHVPRLRDPFGCAGLQLSRRQPARCAGSALLLGGEGTEPVKALLSVRGLRVSLPTATGLVTVVDGIDYEVAAGEVFGMAGESGSGKTISVLALLDLLPDGAVVEGTALFEGRDLLRLGRRAMRSVRGREIAMVFQDPITSLHPMMTIGRQLTEHLRFHMGLGSAAANARAAELLEEVRIPDPAGALVAYPHQFSGG